MSVLYICEIGILTGNIYIRTSFAVFSFFAFLLALDMVSVCCLAVVTISLVAVLTGSWGEGRGWLDWKAEGRNEEMEENMASKEKRGGK
jgi:hypothetical protein